MMISVGSFLLPLVGIILMSQKKGESYERKKIDPESIFQRLEDSLKVKIDSVERVNGDSNLLANYKQALLVIQAEKRRIKK
jgi:hypothetical protein